MSEMERPLTDDECMYVAGGSPEWEKVAEGAVMAQTLSEGQFLPCGTIIYNENPLCFCYWYKASGSYCHMSLGPGINHRIVQANGITIYGLEYKTEEFVIAHRHTSWPGRPNF